VAGVETVVEGIVGLNFDALRVANGSARVT
jgi:hypothetical protein